MTTKLSNIVLGLAAMALLISATGCDERDLINRLGSGALVGVIVDYGCPSCGGYVTDTYSDTTYVSNTYVDTTYADTTYVATTYVDATYSDSTYYDASGGYYDGGYYDSGYYDSSYGRP